MRTASIIRVLIVLSLLCLLPFSVSAEPAENTGGADDVESEDTGNENMIDYTHALITDTLVRPVVWFDSFFGEYRSLEEGYEKTYAIWQNDFRLEESKGISHKMRIRAHLRLPRMEERLKLVLSRDGDPGSDEEEDLRKSTVKDEDEDIFLGLGYDLFSSIFSRLTLLGGFRFSIPVEEWARLRYRYVHNLGPVTLFRFTQTAYWDSTDGAGERTSFALERKLNEKTLLRYNLAGRYGESTTGYEFEAQVSFQHQLSPRRAIALDFFGEGSTRPWTTMWNYRVDTRYRQSFYRKWLYYEIVPEVSWPKDMATGKRDAVAALTLRLEMQFRGMGK